MTQIDRNIIKTIEAHKDIIKEKFSVPYQKAQQNPIVTSIY